MVCSDHLCVLNDTHAVEMTIRRDCPCIVLLRWPGSSMTCLYESGQMGAAKYADSGELESSRLAYPLSGEIQEI